jgi:hypothetical protein
MPAMMTAAAVHAVMVVVGINLLYSVIMPVFTEYTVQSLRERLQESAQAVKQREREAAAKLKEMEEYLDLRALQARQVLSRCCCCCCCCCCCHFCRPLCLQQCPGTPGPPSEQGCSTFMPAHATSACSARFCYCRCNRRPRGLWLEASRCEADTR